MSVQLKILRFNPESKDPKPYYQNYEVDMPLKDTVLNALLKVRSEQDRTLGFRCSCRSAICGSCSMKVNGQSGLACNIQIEKALKNGEILIEPPGNMPVIRDLIVDFNFFWDKVHGLDPWLKTKGAEPERENLCSNESMYELSKVTECIMCGSCVSDCTVMEVDKNFLGPAALAKVYRFVSDPREGSVKERLAQVSKYGGIWDCTHCFACVEACPKKVLPMDRILSLRKMAMEAGFTNNAGTRHSNAIADSVFHSGSLNETTVLPKSYGWWNIKELLALIPGGLRMLKRGKMPSLFHKPIPSIHQVRKIFKRMGQEKAPLPFMPKRDE